MQQSLLLKGVALAATLSCAPAMAGLEFCNKTAGKVQVSVGYHEDGNWIAEGWWGIQAGECYTPTPLKGNLRSRYYYYFAQESYGEGYWGGDDRDSGYMFCVDDEPFTLRDGNCEDRGYRSESFEQVDTGESRSYTVNLRD